MDGVSVARLSQSGSASWTVFLSRGAVCLGGTLSVCSSSAKGGGDNGSGCPPSSFNQPKSCSEGVDGVTGSEAEEGLPKLFSQLKSSSDGCFSSGRLKGWAGWTGCEAPPNLLSQSKSSSE